jgi:hypothetical protein
MSKYIRSSARASLAIVGQWIAQMQVWQMTENPVRTRQKVIRHTPCSP